MSFEQFEASQSDGSPIEVYTITYDFNRWYYTSADEDYGVAPAIYRAVPCNRSAVELSTDETTAEFKANFPLDSEFLELYRVSPPTGIVSLLCERIHRSDPDFNREIVFKGTIINVAWSLDSADVTCESSSQTITNPGLRRNYQYGCPHMLYGPSCRVDREQFKVETFVGSIAGTQLAVSAAAGRGDGYYAGGYVEYTHSQLGTVERVSVAGFTSATGVLTLFSIPPGLSSGQDIKLFAGCNRTVDHCGNKFNNALNYGGQPFIPSKNPFGANPLF